MEHAWYDMDGEPVRNDPGEIMVQCGRCGTTWIPGYRDNPPWADGIGPCPGPEDPRDNS